MHAGVAPNSLVCSSTPLWEAATGAHSEIVDVLLEAGADANQANTSDNSTPLSAAANRGALLVVQRLVRVDGILLNVPNNDGATPLWRATLRGHTTVVHCLVDAGADVNLTNNQRQSPLLLAAKKGYLAIVELLAKAHVQLDYQGYDDFTALHFAIQNHHHGVVDLLIAAGANVSIPSRYGTPLEWAVHLKQREYVMSILASATDEYLAVAVEYLQRNNPEYIDESAIYSIQAAMKRIDGVRARFSK